MSISRGCFRCVEAISGSWEREGDDDDYVGDAMILWDFGIGPGPEMAASGSIRVLLGIKFILNPVCSVILGMATNCSFSPFNIDYNNKVNNHERHSISLTYFLRKIFAASFIIFCNHEPISQKNKKVIPLFCI